MKRKCLSIITFIGIFLFLSYGAYCAYNIYLLSNWSHVYCMEEKEITYISDSNPRKDIYCISKNGTVYEYADNMLTEIKELSGAKEIIVNEQGTFVLCKDGSLYSYDKNSKSKEQVLNSGECVDIVNCNYFYAAILSNNELLMSCDIVDTSDFSKDVVMQRVKLKTKCKSIAATKSIITSEENIATFGNHVLIVDENNDLWAYGNIGFGDDNNYGTKGLHMAPEFGKIDYLMEGCGCGMVYKMRNEGLMYYGLYATGDIGPLYTDDDAFLLRKIYPNLKMDDVVQIKANRQNIAFVDCKNAVYSIFHENKNNSKVNRLARFKDNINIYLNNYDIYAISENGEVYVTNNEVLAKTGRRSRGG